MSQSYHYLLNNGNNTFFIDNERKTQDQVEQYLKDTFFMIGWERTNTWSNSVRVIVLPDGCDYPLTPSVKIDGLFRRRCKSSHPCTIERLQTFMKRLPLKPNQSVSVDTQSAQFIHLLNETHVSSHDPRTNTHIVDSDNDDNEEEEEEEDDDDDNDDDNDNDVMNNDMSNNKANESRTISLDIMKNSNLVDDFGRLFVLPSNVQKTQDGTLAFVEPKTQQQQTHQQQQKANTQRWSPTSLPPPPPPPQQQLVPLQLPQPRPRSQPLHTSSLSMTHDESETKYMSHPQNTHVLPRPFPRVFGSPRSSQHNTTTTTTTTSLTTMSDISENDNNNHSSNHCMIQ